ncbi:MAG: 1-acyl-sn-glycerol-3-phosphate acyltransferase [Chloroflexi bacterium]|nr:1-acyl-sn-glycerol-3-phosphate acyltransferase [Chloroflexota bacterium]
MSLMYSLGKGVAWTCFHTFGRLEVKGRENVPPRGRVLIIANHQSNGDPPLLAAVLPRQVHFMGKDGLFKHPLAAWAMRAWNVHPVRREGRDSESLMWMVRRLEEEEALVVFPEGTRHPRGMGKGNRGVAYAALKTQATILPVGITGTEHIRSFGRIPFPFCRLRVNVGLPFSLPTINGRVSDPVMESLTDMMMSRVADLLPPAYQGVYRRTNPVAAQGDERMLG